MKKIFKGIIMPVMIISFIGLVSCKDRSGAMLLKIREKPQRQIIENKIEENLYPIPTSAEVLKDLANLEVGYIIGLTNPLENSKRYFTSTERAINLGVYGSDLSYITLYNMEQEVINCLDVIRSISNELNMSDIYDVELYPTIRKNFDNRDELVNILTGLFNDTYSHLSNNNQKPLAFLVVGGAWVEGMYLTTHVTYASYLFADFARVLIKQKESFELFVSLAEPYTSDQGVSDFLKLLDPVKEVYKGLTTSLTVNDINDITEAIEYVRSQIIL